MEVLTLHHTKNIMICTLQLMAQLLFIVVSLVLHKKDIILLSNTSLIVYEAGEQTGITNTEFIKFTLSEGNYSIDDFNAKIKISILEQR